ncbi:hypothetical protein Pen02_80190 [Plantactinospora endophytica]|uniref:LamG-like jellyroll fold domain-containing protein n=2 Tax=Plantactinospora endophytica TaxID=673535 RepID=A0ABQ4EEC8_9ACTN|nr:hypothetical protein Pen02_80190 [Plantactinospora endophytica]
MRTADADAGTTITRAYSPDPVVPGEWTHVAGSYDHTRKLLTLYLDGQFMREVPFTAAWHAPGPLTIGAAQVGGAPGMFWAGELDDVHVFAGVLARYEIAAVRAGIGLPASP